MTRMNKQQVVDHWCHASRLEGVDHTRGTQAATEQSKAFLQTLMDLIDIEQARYRYLAQNCSPNRSDGGLPWPSWMPCQAEGKKTGTVLVLQFIRAKRRRNRTRRLQRTYF